MLLLHTVLVVEEVVVEEVVEEEVVVEEVVEEVGGKNHLILARIHDMQMTRL